uniref:RiboL-PSP-HEPN domain-containing protein n=1 Tax=Candidatus Kentrum sp. LFY TaxID=2126342 RepID=A0A450U688_9GAMM|nr:MAG: hypothetical protein BECKLFY1418A_GA0070994_100122 [Candidatus Kentron sp. LFY]
MNGQAEIARLKKRLDITFERTGAINDPSLELQSDFAGYLCILVSGYLEKAVAALLLEHARQCGAPMTLQRFVERKTRRPINLNAQRLGELLGSFDPEWKHNLERFLVDEYKDAVNSIVRLRNKIAHGESVDLTYRQISDYYIQVQKVVDQIARLCCEN